MTDRATVKSWLAGYVRAWTTNDPADIEALFTPDAIYRPTPHSDGWRGHAAIVDGWLGRKDDPGTCSFEPPIPESRRAPDRSSRQSVWNTSGIVSHHDPGSRSGNGSCIASVSFHQSLTTGSAAIIAMSRA